MTNTLKPCHWCGGRSVLQWSGLNEPEWWVDCDECTSRGPAVATSDEAMRLWNTRPRETELDAELVHLRSLLKQSLDAVNDAFLQAHAELIRRHDAEFNDHDRIASKYDQSIREWRTAVRTALGDT